MFVQIKDGRIVGVSNDSNGFDFEINLPENFDFDHIGRYEVVDNELIEHDVPESAEVPSMMKEYEARFEKLEAAISTINSLLSKFVGVSK